MSIWGILGIIVAGLFFIIAVAALVLYCVKSSRQAADERVAARETFDNNEDRPLFN